MSTNTPDKLDGLRAWREASPKADFACAASYAAPSLIKQSYEALHDLGIELPPTFVEYGAGNIPLVGEELRNHFIMGNTNAHVFLEDPRYEDPLVRLHALHEILSCLIDENIHVINEEFLKNGLGILNRLTDFLYPQRATNGGTTDSQSQLEDTVLQFLQPYIEFQFSNEPVETYQLPEDIGSYNLVINSLFNYIDTPVAADLLSDPDIATLCYVNGSGNIPIDTSQQGKSTLPLKRKFNDIHLSHASSLDAFYKLDELQGANTYTSVRSAFIPNPSRFYNDPAKYVRNPEIAIFSVNNILIANREELEEHRKSYIINNAENINSAHIKSPHDALSQMQSLLTV